MFDFDRRSSMGSLAPTKPLQTEFTVRLDQDQALTVQLLAARAGVTVQEVMQALYLTSRFRASMKLATSEWSTRCADTGVDIPSDMTNTRNDFFDSLLFEIGLLQGEARDTYMARLEVVEPGQNAG